jgi:hypothetical protein
LRSFAKLMTGVQGRPTGGRYANDVPPEASKEFFANPGDKVDSRHWGVNAERMLESCRRWAAQP